MSTLLQLDPMLTYKDPQILDSGFRNYVAFKPVSNSYTVSQTINVHVDSNTEFWDNPKSIIEFDATFTADTAGCSVSTLGFGTVLKSVSEVIGGISLPTIKNLPVVLNSDYRTNSESSKNFLQKSCLYEAGTSGAFTTGSHTVHVVLPMVGHLKTCSSPLPLPKIANGVELSFEVNTANKVFTTGAVPTDLTITNFQILADMLRPSDQYLLEFSKTLAGGGAIQLPIEIVQTDQFSITTSTNQAIKFNAGFRKSLNSIIFDIRSSDTFDGTSRIGETGILTQWYLSVGSDRYPRNTYVRPARWESMVMATGLTRVEEQLADFSVIPTTKGFCMFNWKSSMVSHYSGIPVENGVVELNLDFGSAPAGTEICHAITSFDATLFLTDTAVDVAW